MHHPASYAELHRAVATVAADIGLVTTVKALSEVMYREMKGTGGCYKLLNATGPVGSQGAQQQQQRQ
jgi:hypothetical protein